jgi:hypothetical protein
VDEEKILPLHVFQYFINAGEFMSQNLERVLNWASCVTGESDAFNENYYMTPPVKTALFRLTHYDSYFIGLIGLVGTGKSSALALLKTETEKVANEDTKKILASKICDENEKRKCSGQPILTGMETIYLRHECQKRVVAIKWNDDLWTMLHDELNSPPYHNHYEEKIFDNLKEAPKALRIIERFEKEIGGEIGRPMSQEEIANRAQRRFRQNVSFADAEKMLPSKVLEQIREDLTKEVLIRKVNVLLIDMPDYSQKGSWKINKDLDGITALWNMLRSRYSKINIIVCLQQELVMKQPHLILGKMDKIFLKTLTAEQLLEAYKQFFVSYEPFSEDALRLVAKLSRGVFRRFKNYVRLCLELVSIEGTAGASISVEQVRKAISKEQLILDMDLELSDIFKNRERKLQAFNILDFVRENPDASQKTISDALGVHPNTVGDVVKQLCTHNYLQVKRGKGTEQLVALKD